MLRQSSLTSPTGRRLQIFEMDKKVLCNCLTQQFVMKMVSYAYVVLPSFQMAVKSLKSSFSPLHMLGQWDEEDYMQHTICLQKSSYEPKWNRIPKTLSPITFYLLCGVKGRKATIFRCNNI